MSKITEVAFWEPTVYQADTNKPNKAGPAVFDNNGEATDGFLNAGVQQVTNRTAYLKETLDGHIGSRGTSHTNATQTEAGFMSSSDKTKLNSVETGAQANVGTDLAQGTRTTTTVPVTSSTGTSATLGVATTALAGVMSSADKTKLDGIATGAQVNTVTSVASKTGAVTLVKGDVGLGNVDNTADTAKPVSTAQQTALNLKANLASPALTGTPTAPTATVGTNTTQVATTAFVLANSSASALKLFHIQDQKAATTSGGSLILNTYTNRDLNTTLVNQIPSASLTSNTITLPAGSYYIDASSPYRSSGSVRTRLYNTTDSTTTLLGTCEYGDASGGTVQVKSFITGYFTLASSKSLVIQYTAGASSTVVGLGTPRGQNAENELYTDVRIWKLS